MNLAMAGVMNQPQIREVFCTPTFLGNPMMDVEILAIFQMLVADRASARSASGRAGGDEEVLYR